MGGDDFTGDSQYAGVDSHFQIQWHFQHFGQQSHVAILDVPPIFPQMHGNTISTSALRDQRSIDRIGLMAATGLSDRCDMIDVYSESDHRMNSSSQVRAAFKRFVLLSQGLVSAPDRLLSNLVDP